MFPRALSLNILAHVLAIVEGPKQVNSDGFAADFAGQTEEAIIEVLRALPRGKVFDVIAGDTTIEIRRVGTARFVTDEDLSATSLKDLVIAGINKYE